MRHPVSLAAIGLLAVAATACNLAKSLTPETSNQPLTPARQLAGTWSTTFPVTMYYQTDFCTGKEVVGTAPWNVTWILTAVQGFTNVLDVEMRYSAASMTRVASSCGSGSTGWFPLPSPIFLRMTVSSSAFTASDSRNGISVQGSYTTDLMQATWVRYDCLIYCVGEYSKSNELKLVRR